MDKLRAKTFLHCQSFSSDYLLSAVHPSTCHALQFSPNTNSIPTHVAPKPKSCKRANKVLFDEQGFPDKTKDYNNRLHNMDGGFILQHKKYSVPKLDAVNPLFNYEFNETLHGAQLAKEFDVSHLLPDQAS
jgi:hypothetical protein